MILRNALLQIRVVVFSSNFFSEELFVPDTIHVVITENENSLLLAIFYFQFCNDSHCDFCIKNCALLICTASCENIHLYNQYSPIAVQGLDNVFWA